MSVEPYNNARRVFVIVDNASAHRGKKSIKRPQGRYKNLILVHTPVHASWLNQAEIYFSIVQRKVLTSNDFPDLDTLQQQLLTFGRRYEQIAAPFQWKFTRARPRPPRPTNRPTRRPGSLTTNTSAKFRARALSESPGVDAARRECDPVRSISSARSETWRTTRPVSGRRTPAYLSGAGLSSASRG